MCYIPASKHKQKHKWVYAQYFNELLDAGYIGLCKAALDYDNRPSCSFKTFAYKGIWRNAFNALASSVLKQKQSRILRAFIGPIEFFSEKGVEFDIVDAQYNQKDESKLIYRLIRPLLEKRRLRIFYWRVSCGMTLQEISDKEGIVKERVRQLHRSSLVKIRKCEKTMRLLERFYANSRETFNFSDFYRNVGFSIS